MSKTTRITECRCPHCDKRIDSATGAGHDRAPSPGDVTICFGCAEWSAYTEELGLRVMTDEEYEYVAFDPVAIKTRQILLRAKSDVSKG